MAKLRDYEAYEIANLGIPEGWIGFRWSRLPEEVPEGFVKVTGAVTPNVYKSGPRKGSPNFKTRDKSTERILFIKPEDVDAWLAESDNADNAQEGKE
jgi:hypothetical protein